MISLNNFDKQQIELLSPLFDGDNPVILHYPFYANTFPLAYHYFLLLKQQKVSSENIKKLIKPHIWATEFPSRPNRMPYLTTEKWEEPKKINIFYANEITANDLVKETKKFEPEKLDTVFYTRFVHRFFFLEYNPWSLAIRRKYPKEGIEPQMLNDRHFSNTSDYSELFITLSEIESDFKKNYKRINIYTDLPVEAQHLFSPVFNGIELVIYDQSELNFINDEVNEVLNIYFYGGPTAFHYLSQSDRFIPVFIDETRAKAITTAKGVVCIHYNGNQHIERIVKINAALTAYHEKLFGMSEEEKGAMYLNNIRISYNKLAKILNHPSYFRNAQAFANCLAVHHLVEEFKPFICDFISPRTNQTTSPPCDSYNLVHIGAGKLGIGLVLPLFHSNESCVNVTVVQKSRSGGFDWKALQRESNIILTSRYGCQNESSFNWELNLKVATVNKPKDNENAFMLIEEYSEILDVLKKADVITFSLSDKIAQKQFNDFIELHKLEFKKEVFIFPFENSSEKPDSLDITPSVKFRILKPDRICIDRYLSDDHTIKVTNESHFEVVIQALNAGDEKQIRKLFDPEIASNNLIICDNENKYNFYEKRKKYLLNELHFVLAVYGYHFLIDKKINNWQYQYVTVIQSALKDNPEYSKPIDTYIKLQILRIITECDEQTYFKETGTVNDYEIVANSLLRYADQVKTRFNESEADPLHRVFAISTLFDEVDIAKFTFPDTVKIRTKYKENFSKLNDFYKNEYPNELTKNYTLRPPSIEIAAFLEDYKNKLDQVFRRAALNAAQADEKTKRVIDKRKAKLDSFNAEITEILTENQ